MRSRRSLRSAAALAGLAGSLAFSYLAVRDVDFAVFWDGLASSNYWWLVPSLAVLAAAIFLRALRWRFLFRRETRPPLGATTRALLIGYFFNNILPVRAGEALRVVALHEEAGTSRAEALGTAVTERVYDILALLVLLFVATPWLPEVTWLRRVAVLALVFAVAVAVAIGVLRRWQERPLRFALRPLALLPGVSAERTERAAANVVQGLAAVHRARVALPAFALTIVAILVMTCSFWLVTLAFDLGVGFGAGLLVMVTTNLAMVIPSSPAAVGVFEAATLVALNAYGIGDSRGLSYAVVLHGVNFFPFVAAGFFLLKRQGGGLRRRSRLAASA